MFTASLVLIPVLTIQAAVTAAKRPLSKQAPDVADTKGQLFGIPIPVQLACHKNFLFFH